MCCKEDMGVLNIPDGDLGGDYSLVFVDTTTIKSSTVLLDSIPTSFTENLLIGKYTDEKLGEIEAKAFFQVWIASGQWKPKSTLVFDSIVLLMQPIDYYYGDQTVDQTFEIKEVTEDFKYHNLAPFWIEQGYYSGLYTPNSFFNNTNYTTGQTLGSFTVRKQKIKATSFRARLNDSLGEDWLAEALKTTGSAFNNNRDFLTYFKGISIESISPIGASILGLGLAEIKLYCHDFSDGLPVGQIINFSFSADVNGFFPYKFNNITAERGALPVLSQLTALKEIPSSLTNEETYIQSGVGIVSKVTFPHIKQLLNLPGLLQVTDAKLVVRPVKDPKRYLYPLPKQLILFTSDRNNFPRQVVGYDLSADPAAQTAQLVLDNELNINTRYTFTITQYIKAMLSSSQRNVQDQAFMISTVIGELEGTVNRIAIGSGDNGNYSVTLEVYYLRKNE